MTSFGRYSDYYDLLYRDKDYEKETDFIVEAFRRAGAEKVKTVLDCGCGTGGHALPLARRGYDVAGFDLSPVMLSRAQERAAAAGLKMDLRVGDLRDFEFQKKFDACVCMFAVLGYVTDTAGVLQTLANVRKHLKPGAPFIFDCWNGLAVLKVQPSERAKIVEDGDRRVLRLARPEMDAYNHVCKVHYHLFAFDGKRLVDEVKETHHMRFFFPQEITQYLHQSGFEVTDLSPFMEQGKVDENTWNIAVVSRAV